MSESVNIQWFPGHMAKTRRLITESLRLVDAVAEIIDARIPASSRNPELAGIVMNKPRIVLLNKADMADESLNALWLKALAKEGAALAVDCRSGKGLKSFLPTVHKVLADKLEQYAKKGMAGRPLRIMVVGIPNVGKSSFINRMSGGARTKVADRPGVTRGNQWVSAGKGVELLDTAGVLWPKFEDPLVGEHLAFTGAVKDVVTDVELLAARLLEVLAQEYEPLLCARYGLQQAGGTQGQELLQQIGRRRGMLISGGEVDTERAGTMVLDEFRSGKLGRITLERP